MNCPKCNAILRPGVKFCTSCGQKIETSATCTQCGAPLKSGAKFCIKCGQRVTLAEKTSAPSQETTSDINSVKGRIYWNIQPGQVARIINETEFDSYNNIHCGKDGNLSSTYSKTRKRKRNRQRKLSTYNSKIWFWKTPRKEPLSLLLSYWISLSRFFSVPSKERLMLTRILSRWTYKPGIWIWR